VVFSVNEGRQIGFEQLPVEKTEPLVAQYSAFLDAVESRQPPKLDGRRARRTLEVALAILAKIEEHSGVVARALVPGWKP
jgi:predicted dehydrogenase